MGHIKDMTEPVLRPSAREGNQTQKDQMDTSHVVLKDTHTFQNILCSAASPRHPQSMPSSEDPRYEKTPSVYSRVARKLQGPVAGFSRGFSLSSHRTEQRGDLISLTEAAA